MRVVEIRLANIMCFDEKIVKLGRHTRVTGRNGAGKSTIAESVKSVIGGGSDATLLRAGAEEGEIVLVLDDGMELIKRITTKGSSVTVKHPEYGKISKPQSVIESLAMIATVNPVSFLTMPDKKRAEYLLDVCPIEVTEHEITAAVGDVPLVGLGELAGLELIEENRHALYDARTATNGALKDKLRTIATLSASLPDDRSELERDLAAEIAAKEAERAGIVEDAEKRIQNLSDTRLVEAQRMASAKAQRIDDARMRHRAEVKSIEEQIETLRRRLHAKESKLDAELASIEAYEGAARDAFLREYEEQKQTIRNEALPKIGVIDNELATLSEASRHVERYRQTARQVDEYAAAAVELERQAAGYTTALERLDELKRAKLAALPISGIEIRDGVIYRDDVPFDRLNTAQRVGIAFDLAVLRAGKLPFVFVDGAECLDAESQAELERRATEAGVQLLTFAVSDEDLTITTETEMEVAS